MITEVQGNLIEHVKPNDLIVHVVNDIGVWGGGFTHHLDKLSPEIRKDYKRYLLYLGKVMITKMPDYKVAHLVAQHETISKNNPRPLNYGALAVCLNTLQSKLQSEYPNTPRIIMPKIGSGLAGGDWEVIKELVEWGLPDLNITVYCL